MEQLEFFEVPSPCVGVCTVDEKGYCRGCMRNREERFNWLKLTTAQKLHVIKLCRQRYLRRRRAGLIDHTSAEDKANPQQDLF